MSDDIISGEEAARAISMGLAKGLVDTHDVLLALWTGSIATGDSEKQENIEDALGAVAHNLMHLQEDLLQIGQHDDDSVLVGDSIDKVVFVSNGEVTEFDSLEEALNSLLL